MHTQKCTASVCVCVVQNTACIVVVCRSGDMHCVMCLCVNGWIGLCGAVTGKCRALPMGLQQLYGGKVFHG